jgi:hypothetical protein
MHSCLSINFAISKSFGVMQLRTNRINITLKESSKKLTAGRPSPRLELSNNTTFSPFYNQFLALKFLITNG